MKQHLALVTLVVKDYDEAIHFYTGKLKFTLVEDTAMGNGKRWVVVSPPGMERGTHILLAKATSKDQEGAVGNQTGGRVSFFLHTDDFRRDYAHLKSVGVEFTEEPREEVYGMVVVFKDLYGNKWDLIEPK